MEDKEPMLPGVEEPKISATTGLVIGIDLAQPGPDATAATTTDANGQIVMIDVPKRRKRYYRFRNKIRFNCQNFEAVTNQQPNSCLNCIHRDGLPANLGGDENCRQFRPIG